jgi:hypothetical protein
MNQIYSEKTKESAINWTIFIESHISNCISSFKCIRWLFSHFDRSLVPNHWHSWAQFENRNDNHLYSDRYANRVVDQNGKLEVNPHLQYQYSLLNGTKWNCTIPTYVTGNTIDWISTWYKTPWVGIRKVPANTIRNMSTIYCVATVIQNVLSKADSR